MDREQSPLLSTPQGLVTKRRWPLLMILAGIGFAEVFLISSVRYAESNSFAHRTYSANGHRKNCSGKRFKSQTLKLIREQPFADIFGIDIIDKFENSDVIGDPSGESLYSVVDNTRIIARFGHTLGHSTGERMNARHDALLSWTGESSEGEGGFEYIAYNSSSGMYIAGVESEKMEDGTFRSRSFDVTFEEGRTIVHDSCEFDFKFSHRNKGFEGAAVLEQKGRSFLLCLCEGNFCTGGHKGRMSGNGRLIVMERVEEGSCMYKTVKVVKLPREINFQDYSAISIWNETRVGIASQENAAVFVGELDIDTLRIGYGKIYDLPRNDNCEIKYCTLEGVYFLSRNLVVTVTDSMKGKRKQDYRCREKDESVQVFQIPPNR